MSKVSKSQLFASFCKILSECDIEKISVTQLVNACSVSRQAFYYHFSGVDELVCWGISQAVGEAVQGGRKNKDLGSAAAAFLNEIEMKKAFLFKCAASKYNEKVMENIKKGAGDLVALYVSAPSSASGGERAAFFSRTLCAALVMAAYDSVRFGSPPAQKTAVYINELVQSLRLAI